MSIRSASIHALYLLGSIRSVVSLDIAFYQGTSVSYRFDIETSSDDQDWTLVWTGTSRQGTLQLQPFDIPNMAARYVRISGQGNSIGLTDLAVPREARGPGERKV